MTESSKPMTWRPGFDSNHDRRDCRQNQFGGAAGLAARANGSAFLRTAPCSVPKEFTNKI